jgi:hypothetical protein
MGNLSYFLSGKLASDGPKWIPNLKAVRAAVKFIIATGRLRGKKGKQNILNTNTIADY